MKPPEDNHWLVAAVYDRRFPLTHLLPGKANRSAAEMDEVKSTIPPTSHHPAIRSSRAKKALIALFALFALSSIGSALADGEIFTFPIEHPANDKYTARLHDNTKTNTVSWGNKVKLTVLEGNVFAVTATEIIVARRTIKFKIEPQKLEGWNTSAEEYEETRDLRNNNNGNVFNNFAGIAFIEEHADPDDGMMNGWEWIVPYVRVADMQVDSLNTHWQYGGVSGTDYEDKDENENPPVGGTALGKFIISNTTPYTPDSDKPGWADFTGAPEERPTFAAMHLFLQGFPAGTEVRLIYNGNDPAQVQQNPDGTWFMPDGILRVWTKNIYYSRNAATDYIKPDTAYTLEDLQAKQAQVADGHFVFYVEGVRGSTQTAEQTVKVQVKTPGGTLVDLDTVSFSFIPCDLAVDANRDGVIKFAGNAEDGSVAGPLDITSETKPFRFWCNDDYDLNDTNPDGEDLTGPADSADGAITSKRDLEDFTRLHIYLGGLQEAIANGDIQVGLEWRNIKSGSPSIKINWAAEPDGGEEYLRNTDGAETWAISQASEDQFANTLGAITNGGIFKFPTDFWKSSLNGVPPLSADHPNRYLIFEGVTEGKGQLVLTFWKGTQPLGEGGSVWLDIKNVKKMYQRVDSATGNPWQNVPFEPEANELKKDAIVFVHGWRMTPEGAGNFSETMYKRLWQRGFKGRFVAFHWDTYWHDGWQWVDDLTGVNTGAILAHYNDSEKIAWQAAAALKTCVDGLPFQNKNLIAHSMGNIVASEALKQGMAIKNYALLHAAVPAACYDESPAIQQTQQYNHYTFTMWDNLTPDDDLDPATQALVYRGRFKNLGGNLINFFLTQDVATFLAWEINNDQTKPDGPLAGSYRYKRDNPDGQKLYLELGFNLYLTDPYEAMPYACRSWGKAVGAFGPTDDAVGTHGSIDDSVDLGSSTYDLPGEDGGFGDKHSAEFNARIQLLKPFYDTLIDKFNLNPNP